MEYRDEARELDLMQYWIVILKRKWVLVTFVSVIVVLTGIFSFTTTPIYRASTTILIEESSSKMLSIEDEFGFHVILTNDKALSKTKNPFRTITFMTKYIEQLIKEEILMGKDNEA